MGDDVSVRDNGSVVNAASRGGGGSIGDRWGMVDWWGAAHQAMRARLFDRSLRSVARLIARSAAQSPDISVARSIARSLARSFDSISRSIVRPSLARSL